ncbi:MAG: leucine-rich repeat domain-containing protein [Clostridiales bacterium]|nr:leucine-rich repeat domain-containing protein [Clostridiales bacterium]
MLAAIIVIMPITANAATSGIYTYTVSDGRATITNCDTSASGSITIPSTLGGYPVNGIGKEAFYECSSLTSITIPDGVTSIGEAAFRNCYSLTSITVSKNNMNYSSINGNLFDKNKTTLIQYAIGKQDKQYTIPNSVTSIGNSAFYGCSLTNVTIPDSVTSIGNGAFIDCHSLTSVTIPDSVTSIGNWAFSWCSSLTDVYYGGSEEQWAKIHKGINNTGLTNATIHYNSNIPISVHTTNTNNIANNVTNNLNSLLSKVTLCDTTIYGPTIDILGHDWQPLKFDANAVLDLAGLSKNITIDEDKKTVHVILGKKNVNGQASVVQTTKMCDASWSKQYNEIKDLYKTMTGFDMKGSSGGVNNWNRFEKMKAELNHLQCDFIIDADMSVLGYLDFDYQTGNLKFKEGGLIETASLGMQLKHGTVLYAVLSLKGTEKGTIKAQVSSSGKIEPYMSLAPSLTAMAKLGGNIGIAKIEGGIDATLAMLLQTIDPKFKVSMSGDLFLCGSSPVFNKTLFDKKYHYLNCELYPEFKNNLSASAYSLRAASVGITEDSLDVQPMDRSYLYEVSLMSVTDENSIYTLNSVYPQNNAQLVRLSGDSMMLVWTGDNGTKSDINRSSLMCSIYKNGVWSEIQTINEDGTATGDFKAVTDGTDVYIVYQKMNAVLNDNAKLEEGLKEVDLYYTQYANGEFSEPVRITDNNELFEVIGDVGITDSGLDVVWVENSENNITFSNGTNTIKEYTANKTVENISELTASGEEYIGDVCVGDSGVYYTVVNSADSTSVIYKYDGTASQAFASDAITSDLKEFGGKLYYIKNSAIYSYDGNTESETGIDEISDFKFVSNGNDIAVLASVFDGKGSELFISKLKDGTWSQKERFTDLGKYIRSYSPFMYSDGTINAAVSAADINSLDDEDESVYGNTSIMVLNQCDYFDTSTSYLYYEGDIAPNNKIDLYFDVTNNSSSELNSINVKLTDANQNTLAGRTILCSIAPYATEVLSIPYTLPDDIKLSELSVEISADKAEKDYSNNKASVGYGYANIKVLPISYKLNSNNTAQINTTIKNEGFTDAENVVITVYNGNNNEDILEEKNIGNLNIGDSYELNYTFPEELMVSNEEDAMNAVYVVATTSSGESMYSDNEEKVTFDSSICRIDDITIDGTNINVQFTKNFDEEVLLVVASYADDDILCSVTYAPVNLTDNKNFILDTNGVSYISAFLLKDLNNLTPKCNKLSKYIE